ncbi:MAG TPA: tetratricopeptide repeat protein [Pirellulales bacterium]|nr:tetratricopeptide repeat protein [Pirellulales bacterium]
MQWYAPAAIVAISVIVGLVYSPALRGSYVWDDDANVVSPGLQSWSGLWRIWTQWGAVQTYYPLLHSAFWIEHKLWGDNTLGYHLANVLFHSISVYLVYLILRRLQIPGALLAAAIFAVHPVMVESVAWITEQKNTLSGMLYFGSMLAYLHFDASRRKSTYALALALFVLSLLSKTITVSLPAALLVILWWQRGKLAWRREVVPLLPWFACSLLWGAFTAWYERVYVGAQGTEFTLNLAQKCLLSCRAVWFYAGKMFWPTKLTFIYPRWEIDPGQAWQYLYVVGLLLVLAGAWLVHRRWRSPLAALLFFVGTLFPLLGFFGTYIFLYTFVCDHFQYLASLGIIVPVSAGIALAVRRLPPTAQHVGQALCLVLLGAMAWLSWQQSHMYASAITLYQTTLERNPNCWMAHNNLAAELDQIGRSQEAVEHCQTALLLKPNYAEAHNNLGDALLNLKRPQEAIEHFHQALLLRPNFPSAETNLGNALMDAGQVSDAIQHYQQALHLDPAYALAEYNLGNTYLHLDQPQKAIEHYRQALRLNLDNAEVRYNLGIALGQSGRSAEAIDEFSHALQLNPSFAQAHNNLGATLADLGRTDEAIEHYQEALRLEPGNQGAYKNLTNAYIKANRSDDALATARKAMQQAQAQGQTALAQQIDNWLIKYQASEQGSQKNVSSAPSPTPPGYSQ